MQIDGAEHFGVNTYAYTQRWSAEHALAHLAAQGYRHFELMMHPGFLWPGDMDAAGALHFRRFMLGHQLRLVSINMPNADINITAPSAEMRAASLALIEQVIALGGHLGARGVVVGVGKTNPLMAEPADVLEGRFLRAIERLGRAAERAGTQLWAEPMPFAWEPTAAGVVRLLERHGDPAVRMVYDVANGWFIGEDLEAALAAIGPRLALVHVSDTTTGPYRHDRVGRGTVPFERLPALLANAGYRDLPMLEIIDASPDEALADSIGRLVACGFGPPLTAVTAARADA